MDHTPTFLAELQQLCCLLLQPRNIIAAICCCIPEVTDNLLHLQPQQQDRAHLHHEKHVLFASCLHHRSDSQVGIAALSQRLRGSLV